MNETKVHVHVALVSLKVILFVEHYLDFRGFRGVIRVMKSALQISTYGAQSIILVLCSNINSLRPSDAYMRQWTNHHWFR